MPRTKRPVATDLFQRRISRFWPRLAMPMPLATGLLAGLVCLALIAIEGWWAWSSRIAQLEAAQTEATHLVERAAQQAEGVLDVADSVLLGVAERMQDDGAGPAALQRMDRLLALQVAAYPRLYEIAIIGADGARLASSLADGPPGADSQIDRLIAYHQSHDDSNIYVGPLSRSRRDGRLVLTVSRRFNNPDGSFGGVAEAVIDLNYFQSFYRKLGLAAHGAVSMWRDDGALVVREPPIADGLGAGMRSADLSRLQAFRQQSGSFTMRGSGDGEMRLYAYQHLERAPLILFYGVATRDALAEWWNRTLTYIGLTALLLSLVTLCGWWALPQMQRVRKAEEDNAAAPPLRLLVVDDIANNRDIAAAFLRAAGHCVTHAASGAAAVRAAAVKRYDAILMDVRMPGMDGLEATRQIRALPAPHGLVPIIAVTAQVFPEQIEACRAAGMNHHVSKPFEVESLLHAVATAIGIADAVADAAVPPATGAMPVLDQAIFAATASYLPPSEVAVHMKALVARGQALLAALQGDRSPQERAALAHAMAGAAGTFGFQQIADLGRRFEYAVETQEPEHQALGEALIQTTQATILALQEMAAAAVTSA